MGKAREDGGVMRSSALQKRTRKECKRNLTRLSHVNGVTRALKTAGDFVGGGVGDIGLDVLAVQKAQEVRGQDCPWTLPSDFVHVLAVSTLSVDLSLSGCTNKSPGIIQNLREKGFTSTQHFPERELCATRGPED